MVQSYYPSYLTLMKPYYFSYLKLMNPYSSVPAVTTALLAPPAVRRLTRFGFGPPRGFCLWPRFRWRFSHSLPVRSLTHGRMHPSDVLNFSTTLRTIGVWCRGLHGHAHLALL